jgi:hypothetical protein
VSLRPVVRDRRVAQVGGIAMVVIGARLIYDAYEARGRHRPFWLRFMPG